MADGTKIQWTDASWNPVRGCTRVSPGCVHCYAEAVAARFAGPGHPYAGLAEFVTRPGGAREPRWTGKLTLVEEKLAEPLRWRKPRRIFVNSMSDLFHESVPDEWIDRVFAAMALAPQHSFQVLTKRPERMRSYVRQVSGSGRFLTWRHPTMGHDIFDAAVAQWPPMFRHVWLGVSVEDQQRADERIPILLDTPAAVRWISAEPLLGPLDLKPYWIDRDLSELGSTHDGLLDWVVIGGESGPGARSMDLAWARTLVEQCQAAGVAAFVKQLGSNPVNGRYAELVHDRKGGDPDEWPTWLQVREWPNG